MVKKIHYFWFGNNDKPKDILKCIESWKRYFPDFEIIEWNESNFDVNLNTYTKQAYQLKKYAFVSDVARFNVLYEQGGLYFDTDVEVIRPFGELLELDAFAALETESFVAPGLVLWSKEKGNPIIGQAKEYYDTHPFLDENGNRIMMNVCSIFTGILKENGFTEGNTKKQCGSFTIFPTDYFCPFSDATGVLKKTENTYAIHWYSKSWMPFKKVLRCKITRVFHRIFGVDCFSWLKRR